MQQRSEWPRSTLELREEPDGDLRHFLDDKPIHAGAGLEMLFAGDVWLEGRYEWTFKREDRPVLFFQLGGSWEANPDAEPLEIVVGIPPQALLRWPRRGPFGDRL